MPSRSQIGVFRSAPGSRGSPCHYGTGYVRNTGGYPDEDRSARFLPICEVRVTTTAGRPRDPLVEDRVFRAALDVYGASGWSGFSIEAVARRAKVGKASIYLRWSSKAELLCAALTAEVGDFAEGETGVFRDDLAELGKRHLEYYCGVNADALLRLSGEAHHTPELAAFFESFREQQVRAARGIVRRAIARGDLPADTSVTILLDTFFGGLLLHALATPARLRAKVLSRREQHVADLVDFLVPPHAAE